MLTITVICILLNNNIKYYDNKKQEVLYKIASLLSFKCVILNDDNSQNQQVTTLQFSDPFICITSNNTLYDYIKLVRDILSFTPSIYL